MQNQLKLNCESAIGLSYSFVAVVATDWKGKLVFASSKSMNTNVPVYSEAEAIQWAVQVATHMQFKNVVIELRMTAEAVLRL